MPPLKRIRLSFLLGTAFVAVASFYALSNFAASRLWPIWNAFGLPSQIALGPTRKMALKFITVPARASSNHTATVIFLHGLGDTGNGWLPVAQMLARRNTNLSHIKWILPRKRPSRRNDTYCLTLQLDAPHQPVTLNFGASMPAWYDIYQLADSGNNFANRKEDEQGLLQARESIRELLATEMHDVPAHRIVLGGFSQGAVVSYLTGLTSDAKLAGLAILSGYMPLPGKIASMASPQALSLPIFVGHGVDDPLIPLAVATASLDVLQKDVGVKMAKPPQLPGIEYHQYEGLAHSADPVEIGDLGVWLERVLPA